MRSALKRPTSKDQSPESVAQLGQQYAALPYRFADGVEIMLITSRETRRWVIPKGWPMKGKRPFAAAAREALEEAGISGKVGRRPIGVYRYVKRLANGAPLLCVVDVFALQVTRQRGRWREKGQRLSQWFTPEEAAEAVQEPELKDLIERFGRIVTRAALLRAPDHTPPLQ